MSSQNLYFKILSIYQIIGGVVGIGLTFWLISITKNQSILQYLFILFAIVLNLFSIYCGKVLFRNKIKGLKMSLINQMSQLVNFSIYGYGFKYIAGFYISAGINLSNENLLFKFGLSSWEFLYNAGNDMNEIHINLFALILIIYIGGLIKIVNEDNYHTLEIDNIKAL
jgi:hypothetical protein